MGREIIANLKFKKIVDEANDLWVDIFTQLKRNGIDAAKIGWVARDVFDYTNKLGVNLTLKELVGVTNVLVDYCINGYSKELGDRLESIDKFILDKFKENE